MSERKLTHRMQLAELCNEAGLTTAVEIGTHQGYFADQLMSGMASNVILYCVDSWAHDPLCDLPIYGPCFIEQALGREFDESLARLVLTTKYKGRVQLIKATSVEAAAMFEDGTMGLVYIDGEHDLENVTTDIAAWWPKVQPGGILAGHDYVTGDPTRPGVVIAVDEFVMEHNLQLFIIEDEEPSWYVRKPL